MRCVIQCSIDTDDVPVIQLAKAHWIGIQASEGVGRSGPDGGRANRHVNVPLGPFVDPQTATGRVDDPVLRRRHAFGAGTDGVSDSRPRGIWHRTPRQGGELLTAWHQLPHRLAGALVFLRREAAQDPPGKNSGKQ